MMHVHAASDGPASINGSSRPSGQTTFSPERALEAVGDRWSLRIFRDAMFRNTSRFADFEERSGAAPDILAARLDGFVGAGLMETRQTGDGIDYLLTDQGRNLEPVIIALTTWGDGWTGPQGPPIAFPHDAPITEALRQTHLTIVGDAPAETLLIEITLLGAFSVRVNGTVVGQLSVGSQRLLVFLALHHRSVTRIAMAGKMWPEVSDERAGISLRSALSRLDTSTREAVLSASAGLSLVESVAVDLRDARALAARLVQPDGSPLDSDLSAAATATLSMELLPDWYDDWVVAEAEDWRQLRMNALEAQAAILAERGRLAEAAGAARAAIKVEPLRESAHASLIRVHLAEGNQSEALRVYDRYLTLLREGLGLEPTNRLTDLIADIRRA
ncbi:MAG TPA: BTAD domain-containing putative transcriptional regulator [Lacisediminihabitans sp.]|uniref:BTAD domain-containing putative transcriptional regulator n=1 Tax=Lacisediminihabitans sp. TaxID=2787631 RepID=UPI002EDA40E6